MNKKFEKEIQNNFINQLCKEQGYIRLPNDFRNPKNYFKFLVKELEKLNNREFKENEKKELEETFMHNHGLDSFDFALYIWGKDSFNFKEKEKTHSVFMPKFIDFDNWENNKFYVIDEVTITEDSKKRIDVLIFINGIPLIVFELKEPNTKIDEAIRQLKEYREEVLRRSIFRFCQILIASNFKQTKLWTNDRKQKPKIAFLWDDGHVNGDLTTFGSIFLKKKNLIKYLKNYIIFKVSKTKESKSQNRKILLMRPYQTRAVDKVIDFVSKQLDKNELNANNNMNNGLVWHATGSGKTVTSFKTAEILKNDERLDKVIFLIDRKDLSFQTSREFSEMASLSTVESKDLDLFSTANSTKHLIECLKRDKFIITTIQKLHILLNNDIDKIKDIMNKKYLFIIDECHRSQNGDMGDKIKNFMNNSIMIGFTGTPIFDAYEETKKTEDIFGKTLDVYNILDAIEDKNVLAFNIHDNISVLKIFNEKKDGKKPNMNKYYKAISNHIIKMHKNFTQQKKYNAIFAVDSIDSLKQFYDLLSQDKHLFVTAIFNKTDKKSDDDDEINDDEIKNLKLRILKNYNDKIFNKEKYTLDKFNDFMAHVQHEFKQEDKKIDILIVVKMLLTGYDSRITNTLYVAKKLEQHNLIQAFSRTNRIYNNKKQEGYIINFTIEKEQINKAFETYSKKPIHEVRKLLHGQNYSELAEEVKNDEKKFVNYKWENNVLYLNGETFDFNDPSQKFTKEIFNKIVTFLNFVSELKRKTAKLRTYPQYHENRSDFLSDDKLHELTKDSNAIAKKIKPKQEISLSVDYSFDDEDDFILDDYEIYKIDAYFLHILIGSHAYSNDLSRKEGWVLNDVLKKVKKRKEELLKKLEHEWKSNEINQTFYEVHKEIAVKWENHFIDLTKNEPKDKFFSKKEFDDLTFRTLQEILENKKDDNINSFVNKYSQISKNEIYDDLERRIETKSKVPNKAIFWKKFTKNIDYDDDIIRDFKNDYFQLINSFFVVNQVITEIKEMDNIWKQN